MIPAINGRRLGLRVIMAHGGLLMPYDRSYIRFHLASVFSPQELRQLGDLDLLDLYEMYARESGQ